jgi:hypothetical protein
MMRDRDAYILNESRRKRGRDLTAEELDAIANRYLAAEFDNAKLPDSTHRRFKGLMKYVGPLAARLYAGNPGRRGLSRSG